MVTVGTAATPRRRSSRSRGDVMVMEIERKFLVDPRLPIPREALLDEFRISFEQVYLAVNDPFEERVRKRTVDSGVSYHHARLNRIRAGVREVEENEIDGAEYAQLCARRDPRRQIIIKDRTCFVWRARFFELDDIYQPATRACRMLEVQVSDEDESVDLPDFLTVVREVTHVREFTNSSIALG